MPGTVCTILVPMLLLLRDGKAKNKLNEGEFLLSSVHLADRVSLSYKLGLSETPNLPASAPDC